MTFVVEAMHFPSARAFLRMRLTNAVIVKDGSNARPRAALRSLEALTGIRRNGDGSLLLVGIDHAYTLDVATWCSQTAPSLTRRCTHAC